MFSGPHDKPQVTVLTVTYNSAEMVDDFIESLRRQLTTTSIRVVVVDNDSTDATVSRLQRHDDISVIEAGANLGYAGGLNLAMKSVGQTDSILVLNPDLQVEPGAVEALLARLTSLGDAIVVPCLLTSHGSIYESLRREPRILQALGDAVFGGHFTNRSQVFAETVYDPARYRRAQSVEWATGAALLMNSGLAHRIGPWDERFFLYSEETDFMRRARDLGAQIYFEPAARMTHHMGASGSSSALSTLMAVNRIRYIRKHRSGPYAAAFRAVTVLGEGVRSYDPVHRAIAATLLHESSWQLLPGPVARAESASTDFPPVSVIIPAHNEEQVIGATLEPLRQLAKNGSIEVIVATNGCTDDTIRIASAYPGVRVLDVPVASKTAAMNAADRVALHWPRVYLDADIVVSPSALRLVVDELNDGNFLAARPSFRYDDSGARPLVRAFYRARRRIQATDNALWGAGVFALSRSGHERFGEFPAVTGDDLFVDRQFTDLEKGIVDTPRATVVTPKTWNDLISILRRNYRGQTEANGLQDSGVLPPSRNNHKTSRTLGQLLSGVRGPLSAADALVYTLAVVVARASNRVAPGTGWERDNSSRAAAYGAANSRLDPQEQS